MANFSDPQYKANFGFQMLSLPNPSIDQLNNLKIYENAPRVGYSPSFSSTSCGYNYNNISWTTRTNHAIQNFSYNQQHIDCLNENASDLRCAVNLTVSSFKKHSELDRGIIVNFFAA